MKFVVIISVGLVLVGLVVAQKNPACSEKLLVDGKCPDEYSGHTYRAKRCSRENVHAKCDDSINARFEDFYLRTVDQFGLIMADVISSVRNLFRVQN